MTTTEGTPGHLRGHLAPVAEVRRARDAARRPAPRRAPPGTGGRPELLVLDTRDVAGEPVARVGLPRGVPTGFHGSWLADAPA